MICLYLQQWSKTSHLEYGRAGFTGDGVKSVFLTLQKNILSIWRFGLVWFPPSALCSMCHVNIKTPIEAGSREQLLFYKPTANPSCRRLCIALLSYFHALLISYIKMKC